MENHRYQTPSTITWKNFRERYEQEQLPSLAEKTGLKIKTVLNAVETIVGPSKLRDLPAGEISLLQTALRKKGLSENTILGYLAHLRAALAWAVDLKLLHQIAKIVKPKRARSSKLMKGRPVTEAEFQSMLRATPKVVGEDAAASWQHYLKGLFLSGLRLGESLDLCWDDDSKLCLVFEDGYLLLRIPGELEKGNRDRLLPLTPDFVDFLLTTPEADRTGRVFKLKAQKIRGDRLTADRVTRIVAAIGKKAGFLVDKGRSKYASAHDLRRSFGERWAARLTTPELMEAMRHESIETTLRYYVGRDARRTMKRMREAFDQGNSAGNNEPKQSDRDTNRDTDRPEDKNAKS